MTPKRPLVTSNRADSLVKLMEASWDKTFVTKLQLDLRYNVQLCTRMPNDNVVHTTFLLLYFNFKIVTAILAQK